MNWEGYIALGVLGALAIATPAVMQLLRERRLSRAGLDDAHAMSDDDMLQHVAALCWALGYGVFRPAAHEPALDLILTDGLGHRQGVFTRYWREQIDGPIVETAAAAVKELQLGAALLVSVNGFTYLARSAARREGARLWGLPELTESMERVREGAIAYPEPPPVQNDLELLSSPDVPAAGVAGRLPEQATAASAIIPPALQNPRLTAKPRRRPMRLRPGEAWSQDEIPTCPRCDRKMVVRSGTRGDYWGCPTYPRCLGTRPR